VSTTGRRSRGVLRRRSVRPTIEVYIGKETNKLEGAEVGLIHKLGQFLDVYADLRRGPWERLVRPVLKDIPAWWLEEWTGLSRRSIQRLRNGHSQPRPKHERALTAAASRFARERLTDWGIDPKEKDLVILKMYSEAREKEDDVKR
jgi:hypothetical protein